MGERLLMLDSGAFSVWNKGQTIDLPAYIDFCVRHPDCSYYVSLDVIPGRARDPFSCTPAVIEAACQQGWSNYLQMTRVLPQEKVIPVFHQGDNWEWLQRYREAGVEYIGISPSNDRTTEQKLAWLCQVRKHLCGPDGNPLIKTHGFAVTSFRLMKFWHWHSVDSASWMAVANFGGVYVPHQREGRWDYSRSPHIISVTPKSPNAAKYQAHYDSLSPTVRAMADRYFADCGAVMGEFRIKQVEVGYKKTKEEIYLDDKKTKVVETLLPGLSTRPQARWMLNAQFMINAEGQLPVDHIYFAGNLGKTPHDMYVERSLRTRLMSYHFVGEEKANIYYVFTKHLEAIKKGQRCASTGNNSSAA